MAFLMTKNLDEPTSSGGYVVRQVIRFAFFMRRPHLQLAAAAVNAIGQIIDLFPPPAFSMFSGPTGDWFEYDAAGLKTQVATRLVGKEQTINGNVSLAGNQGDIPDFSLDYRGFALDRPLFRQRASNLVLSIAASAFDPDVRAASLHLARPLVVALQCSAAYIDAALDGKQARRQALAGRFRCIDISDVSAVSADLADSMPGVHWVNFLGPHLVQTLGGRAALESRLSPNARIDALDGGALVVSLGAQPELGDVNRRPDLEDWRTLAMLAHEKNVLHVPKKVKYFVPEDDATAQEAQERWHLRFIAR
jgi:hypothetical protein